MIHRIPAEAAVGVENVPLDKEGFLLRFRQTLEFGERSLHSLVEFLPAELMEWGLDFGLHGFWMDKMAWWSVRFGTKIADDGSRIPDGDLDVRLELHSGTVEGGFAS